MIHQRRTTTRRLLILAAAAIAAIGTARGEAAKGKPNILFLLSDDHSYPYLGAYGSMSVRSPNLVRLAGEGMRFDSMFVGCPSASRRGRRS